LKSKQNIGFFKNVKSMRQYDYNSYDDVLDIGDMPFPPVLQPFTPDLAQRPPDFMYFSKRTTETYINVRPEYPTSSTAKPKIVRSRKRFAYFVLQNPNEIIISYGKKSTKRPPTSTKTPDTRRTTLLKYSGRKTTLPAENQESPEDNEQSAEPELATSSIVLTEKTTFYSTLGSTKTKTTKVELATSTQVVAQSVSPAETQKEDAITTPALVSPPPLQQVVKSESPPTTTTAASLPTQPSSPRTTEAGKITIPATTVTKLLTTVTISSPTTPTPAPMQISKATITQAAKNMKNSSIPVANGSRVFKDPTVLDDAARESYVKSQLLSPPPDIDEFNVKDAVTQGYVFNDEEFTAVFTIGSTVTRKAATAKDGEKFNAFGQMFKTIIPGR